MFNTDCLNNIYNMFFMSFFINTIIKQYISVPSWATTRPLVLHVSDFLSLTPNFFENN